MLSLWLAPAPGGAAANLPSIGDPASQTLSPREEDRLGDALMGRLRQQLSLVDDPEITEYIRDLGGRIASASDRPTGSFHFFVVDNPTINAFALPGGYIGVHTGLILAAEQESELAAVLAHEVAHVTQRHIARRYDQSGRHNLAMLAAMLAAVALGSQDAELGQAAISAGMAASAQAQLDFTRANEYEADRIGIRALARAGFDPSAMADFFEHLQRERRLYGNRIPEFLSTHPVNTSRISEARGRAAQMEGPEPEKSSERFALMHAKLRVGSASNPQEAVEVFEGGDPRYRDTAARYGHAVALHAAGRHEAAAETLHRLIQDGHEGIPYQIAYGRALGAAGRLEEARTVFQDALALYPADYSLTVSYARMLLRYNKAAEARSLLRDYTKGHEADATVYRLLSKAAGNAGHPGEAHEAMAEHYYRLGDMEAAVEQMRMALKRADQYHRTSRLQARMTQMQREAELMQEMEERLGL